MACGAGGHPGAGGEAGGVCVGGVRACVCISVCEPSRRGFGVGFWSSPFGRPLLVVGDRGGLGGKGGVVKLETW